jgi:hypothetical protein
MDSETGHKLDKQDKRTRGQSMMNPSKRGHLWDIKPAMNPPRTGEGAAMNEGPRIGPQRVLMALILKYRDKGLKAGGFIGHQRGKLALRKPYGNKCNGP